MKIYELTDRELKLIIDYIRSEARLSYQLKNRLWLVENNLKLQKESLNLTQNFKNKKSILRNNINKEIYKYIIDEDEIEITSSYPKLKNKVDNEEQDK